MGVGLMRSLQPQTSFGLYNFIVNTSKRVLFLPPSDAYVRSFLYLLYTLIKLYYTKALSDQASSLAPIEFFSSGGQESWCLRVIQQQPFMYFPEKSLLTVTAPQVLFLCSIQCLYFIELVTLLYIA